MEQIRAVLTPSEIIEPSSPNYALESQVWSAHKNQHPQLVARPQSIETLSKLIKMLNDTGIEFDVRCGGCGSASSRGVLISMSAFDDFSFNKEEEIVTVGAGQLWRHVDAKVEEFAPGYSGRLEVDCKQKMAARLSVSSARCKMHVRWRGRWDASRRRILDVV